MFTCATNGTRPTLTLSPSRPSRNVGESLGAVAQRVHVVRHRAGVVERQHDFDRRARVGLRLGRRRAMSQSSFLMMRAKAHRHRHAGVHAVAAVVQLGHLEGDVVGDSRPFRRRRRRAPRRCARPCCRLELRSATSAAPSAAFCMLRRACVWARVKSTVMADQADQDGRPSAPTSWPRCRGGRARTRRADQPLGELPDNHFPPQNRTLRDSQRYQNALNTRFGSVVNGVDFRLPNARVWYYNDITIDGMRG